MTLLDKILILSVLFLGVAGNIPIHPVTIEVAMDQHGIVDTVEERRHPLEDISSWELYRQRTLQQQQKQQKTIQHHRQLASYVTVSDDEDEDTPYTIKHKKLKRHIPFAGGDTTHGLMIDAYVNTNHLSFCCCCNLLSPSS
jgi:hypothetical protein